MAPGAPRRSLDQTMWSGIMRFGLTVLAGTPVLIGLLVAGAFRLATQEPERIDVVPPEPAIVLATERGRVLVDHAEAKADLESLQATFEEQQYGSFCGVASAVMATNALLPDANISQESFFTTEVRAVRSYWTTVFLGMTRDALADQLAAHGLEASSFSARDGIDAFRREVTRNLATPGDVLLVNYDRRMLGQLGGGHISPIAAWDADTDRVLVLDTAAYKYPPHWLPVEDLFAAMDTVDPESGAQRGWVSVTRP